MEPKIVFGNALIVPEGHVVGFIVDLTSEGDIKTSGGVKDYLLEITFVAGEFRIAKVLVIARETDGQRFAKPFNKALFKKLEAGEFTEDIKKEVSSDLMRQFEKGEVREADTRQKFGELLAREIS